MALITALGVAVLTAALSKLLAEEIADWSAWLIRRLTKTAVSRLPENQRERYSEEWESDLNERPGRIMKLRSAAGFLRAAFRIYLIDERNQYVERWLQRIRQADQSYARAAAAVNALQSGGLCDFNESLRSGVDFLQLRLKEAEEIQRSLESNVRDMPGPVQFAAMKKLFARRIREIDERFDRILRQAEQIARDSDQMVQTLRKRKRTD